MTYIAHYRSFDNAEHIDLYFTLFYWPCVYR